MKQFILLLLAFINCYLLHAQSVGIGTPVPNASALLDVASTSKGLLIPRMTTVQRIAITGAVGLAVYDTDFKEFYYHDGITWKKILNNEFWNSSPTRSWIYNINDSIGLGTSTPDVKLDVVGNVKTSARIDAGGIVEAGGISSLGTLYVNGTSLLQGAVTGNSSATFNSDITSNSSMIVNDPTAIFQLQNAGVNKGFVQLSGDNLRVGTNSGNSTGDVIVRMDGTDMVSFQKTASAGTFMQMNLNGVSTGVLQTTSTGNVSLTAVNANAQVQLGGEVFINNTANRTGIGTASPTERLHVNGNLLASGNGSVGGDMVVGNGRLTSNITNASYNLLPVCYGRVNASGSKAGGTPNFTSEKFNSNIGEGSYFIHSSTITSSSIILINADGWSNALSSSLICTYKYWAPGTFVVFIKTEDGDSTENIFNFVIFTP